LELFASNKFQVDTLLFSAVDEKKKKLDVVISSHTANTVGIQMIPENEGNITIVPQVIRFDILFWFWLFCQYTRLS
jgi:hypothetical protein